MEASELVLNRPFSSNGVLSVEIAPEEPLPTVPLNCYVLNELLLVMFEKIHREPTSLSFCAIGACEQDAVIFHELVVANYINKTTSVQFLALQRVNVLWCALLTLLERHSLLVGAEQMEVLDSDSEELTAEHKFFERSSVPLKTTLALVCLTFEVLLAKPGSVDSELIPEVDRAGLFLRQLAPLLFFGPLAEGALARLVLASLHNPAVIELKNSLASRAAISAPPSTNPLVIMKYLAPFSRVKTTTLEVAPASSRIHPAPTLALRAAAWATAGSEAAIAVDKQQRSHAEIDATAFAAASVAASAASASAAASAASVATVAAATSVAAITTTSEKACQASAGDSQSNSIRTTTYQGISSFRRFLSTHPYIVNASASLLAPSPVPAPAPAPAPPPVPAPASAPSRDGTGFSLRLRSALPSTSSVNLCLVPTQELTASFALSSALERSRKLQPLCSLGKHLSTSQSAVGFDALS